MELFEADSTRNWCRPIPLRAARFIFRCWVKPTFSNRENFPSIWFWYCAYPIRRPCSLLSGSRLPSVVRSSNVFRARYHYNLPRHCLDSLTFPRRLRPVLSAIGGLVTPDALPSISVLELPPRDAAHNRHTGYRGDQVLLGFERGDIDRRVIYQKGLGRRRQTKAVTQTYWETLMRPASALLQTPPDQGSSFCQWQPFKVRALDRVPELRGSVGGIGAGSQTLGYIRSGQISYGFIYWIISRDTGLCMEP
jgi:hypothetical protein